MWPWRRRTWRRSWRGLGRRRQQRSLREGPGEGAGLRRSGIGGAPPRHGFLPLALRRPLGDSAAAEARLSGAGDGYGGSFTGPWARAARGPPAYTTRRVFGLTHGPSRAPGHSLSPRLGAVHLGPCTDRAWNGMDAVRFGPRTGEEPKTQSLEPTDRLIPSALCEQGCRRRRYRRSAPLGEKMELMPSSRFILSSCNRLVAPSRTASVSVKRKGKRGVVCVFGGDGAGCNVESKGVIEGRIRRRALAWLLASPALSVAFSAYGKTKSMNPYDERRLLQQNKKIQEANRAPDDFPNFIREGFEVKVVTSDNFITRDSGLMYEDIKVGTGDSPKDGQQIVFHYVGYNEAGRRIDSTYIQGSPAKIRLGNKTLVPGFEEGIRDMKPGGKRRIIIPPDLGPPVGPSTFFSAKQFEVFDVELLAVQDCQRRTIAFYSDVVCN
ncbi:uncharacterized protein LOC133890711 [Phragmites australis]|uniref:uncharacterized protein LOC133890711 n=1 Tax=Phragmites australis TaxID=29695 RepID=UPI002D78D1EB|nr:uncharacterized protein LOC133890711 [Phragmites australis]